MFLKRKFEIIILAIISVAMRGVKAKERLLSGAVQAFATKGYAETTIADIVSAADTHISAVNYHFGSKEQLFREALRRAYELANQAYPIGQCGSASENLSHAGADSTNDETNDEAVKTDGPSDRTISDTEQAEQALATFIRSFILRSIDPGPAGDFDRIMAKSTHAEDAPHALIYSEVEPLVLKHLNPILACLLQRDDQQLLRQAQVCVISLAVILVKHPGMRSHLFPTPPDQATLDRYIERQTRATIAAVKSLASSAL